MSRHRPTGLCRPVLSRATNRGEEHRRRSSLPLRQWRRASPPRRRKPWLPPKSSRLIDDEAGHPSLATGDAPAGAVKTEESRRRAWDLVSLVRRCPIRDQLAKVGNTQSLRSRRHALATDPELAARCSRRWTLLTGKEHGVYAPAIVEFLLASPPSEWKLCPTCGGRRTHRTRRRTMPEVLRRRIPDSGLTRMGHADLARARRPLARFGVASEP